MHCFFVIPEKGIWNITTRITSFVGIIHYAAKIENGKRCQTIEKCHKHPAYKTALGLNTMPVTIVAFLHIPLPHFSVCWRKTANLNFFFSFFHKTIIFFIMQLVKNVSRFWGHLFFMLLDVGIFTNQQKLFVYYVTGIVGGFCFW